MTAPRLAAISVDLDEIPNYFAIHGLDTPHDASHAVYDLALARLAEFASSQELPLSLFAIGVDLERAENAAALRRMTARGHEVENHSYSHRYDFTRLGPVEQRAEIARGAAIIERSVGRVPRGFRAPGYTITDLTFDALADLGVVWDSSVFPCPPYYLAKLAALGFIRARGKRSHSVLDHPRVLTAPTEPYRVGRPFTRRGLGTLELPIQVTRGLRLPFIGTTLSLAGPSRARWLTRAVLGASLVNLELHGIDLLDEHDGLGALRPHQPDVRVPLRLKLAALSVAVATLRAAGYRFVTLDQAAQHFARAVV